MKQQNGEELLSLVQEDAYVEAGSTEKQKFVFLPKEVLRTEELRRFALLHSPETLDRLVCTLEVYE